MNHFDSCIIDDVVSTVSDSVSAGIDLNFEIGSSVLNCSVNSIQSVGDAFGIRFPGHNAQSGDVELVNAIAWSADGKYIAAIGKDFLNIYEFNGYEKEITLKLHKPLAGPGSSVAWTPDNYYLAVSVDRSVYTYTFDGTHLLFSHSYTLDSGYVNDVAFSPAVTAPYILASVGTYHEDSFVDTFSFEPGPSGGLTRISTQRYYSWRATSNEFRSVSWKEDGTRLVVGGDLLIYYNKESYKNGVIYWYGVSAAGVLSFESRTYLVSHNVGPIYYVELRSVAWQPGSSNVFAVAGSNVTQNVFQPFALYEKGNDDPLGTSPKDRSSIAGSITWNQIFNNRGLVIIKGGLFQHANIISFLWRNDKLSFADTLMHIDDVQLIKWWGPRLAMYDGQKISVVSFGAQDHIENNFVSGVHADETGYGFDGSNVLNFFGSNRAWNNDVNYSPLINYNVTGYSAQSYESISLP